MLVKDLLRNFIFSYNLNCIRIYYRNNAYDYKNYDSVAYFYNYKISYWRVVLDDNKYRIHIIL